MSFLLKCLLLLAFTSSLIPRLSCMGKERRAVSARHIRIGVGRDYRDVAPAKGVRRGATAAELTVDVSVRKLQ